MLKYIQFDVFYHNIPLLKKYHTIDKFNTNKLIFCVIKNSYKIFFDLSYTI